MSKLELFVIWLLLINVQPVFADDLMSIFQQAIQADPSLKAAQLKVEIGSDQSNQSLGQMLPQITGTANWSTNETTSLGQNKTITQEYPGTRYYISLTQTIFDFAKYWEWRHATKLEDQFAAEAIEAQNKLMNDVVERYFLVLEAEDSLHFTTLEKQATEKQHKQVQKQFEKQLLKITDLYAIEARLDQLAADELTAESQLVNTKEGISELTGMAPQNLSRLLDNIEFKEIQGNLNDWLEVAISQNPALAAKHIAIEAAENHVVTQKSKYFPVVDLQLNYYDTDTGYQSQRSIARNQTEVAAINVNVPIFSGGTTTHQLFEAQHRLELSKTESEETLRALIKETSDAFLTTNSNARRVKAALKALDSAKKSLESMEKGFVYGTVTISDVIKSRKDSFEAERHLYKTKYDYIKNYVRFLHAIGSIAEQNLQEINNWLEHSEI